MRRFFRRNEVFGGFRTLIMYSNIRIVMVNTTHPGNIGSAARAMKTMGLSRLYLVDPKTFPSEEAVWLASGATDVLDKVTVVKTLQEAVADCGLVVGTSARLRRIPWPVFEPRRCGEVVTEESQRNQVAIVFGREAMGLSNDELQMCNFHVNIPGNPEYEVLNVASAIQLICYEIRMAHLALERSGETVQENQIPVDWVRWDEPAANHEEVDKFHDHLTEVLLELEFFDPDNPKQLLSRLKRLFNRARMDKTELNILRGILSRVQAMLRGERPPPKKVKGGIPE